MFRIGLGDIFEINTNEGKAYFQYVKIDKIRGDLINVFNKLFDSRPSHIEIVTNVKDHYYVRFSLITAYKRKLIEKVGYIPLPVSLELPKYVREKHVIRGQFLGWYIIEVNTLKRQFVEKLSPEQKRLSPSGIYNDTLLKEMLEKRWNLENW